MVIELTSATEAQYVYLSLSLLSMSLCFPAHKDNPLPRTYRHAPENPAQMES